VGLVYLTYVIMGYTYSCFIYLRDGYVICCYSVSVIVLLLTFFDVLVSFIFAACSHFGCFMQWFCVWGGG
jgi:hypothetical protein